MTRPHFLALVAAIVLAAPVGCSDDTGGGPTPPSGDPVGGDANSGGDAAGGDTAGDPSGGDTAGDPSGGDTAGDPSGGDAAGDPSGGDAGVDPGSCTVTAGVANHLLMRGDLILPTGILAGGELLVVDDLITCAAVDCSGEPEAAGATLLDCPQTVISPGLINAHDHISFTQAWPSADTGERYDHRHEWRTGANGATRIGVAQNSHALGDSWGEMRQVIAGTTSLFGSGTVPGFLRNLDRASALEGLNHGAARYRTFPLGDSNGVLALSGCTTYSIDDPAQAMGYVAYVPHISEGIGVSARNELLCVSGTVAGSQDLIFETSALIHGIGVSAVDIAMMAGEGMALVWSPRSNTRLYGHTAIAPLYDRLGARIALGTDWSASGSMNILRELACAQDWNTIYWGSYFSDADLVAMVTEWAAEVLGFQDILGTLMPGRVADITIWDASSRAGYDAILAAETSDVVLVLRGGTALYGDADLVTALSQGGDCEPLDVCGRAKGICTPREIATTKTQLETELGASTYPLFYCGTPVDEPSCRPARSGEFDGLPTGTDMDADGVDDSVDNCVGVFNPGRPLELGLQADTDDDSFDSGGNRLADGGGDACDPCPLDAGTTTCTPVDPDDRDNDGVPNLTDNCPWVPNPLQVDDDGDLKGNLCDPCPNDANPGTLGCPSTIYVVKNGTIPVGQRVTIGDAIVTAPGPDGFFMQTDPASGDYTGPDFSAIYVYDPGVIQPERGWRVAVDGVVADYFTQLELTGPTVTVLDTTPSLLTPLLIDPTDAAPGGPKFAEYESLLTEVVTVTVLDIMPAGEIGETVENEFLITGNLSVDDKLYLITPWVTNTQVVPRITGVLRRHWQRNKLLPRDTFDVDLGPPALIGFGPATVEIYEGTTAGSSASLLIVTVSPAPLIDTFISVTSADGTLVDANNGGTTVLAGMTTAEVLLDTPNGPGGPVTLTAALGIVNLTADVTVLDASIASVPVALSPSPGTASFAQDVIYTVTLDKPAPPGDQVVDITATGVSVTVPASITVPFFDLSAEFVVSTGSTQGLATITVAVGATQVDAELNVVDVPPVGLILVEVLYDVAGTSGGTDDQREWVKIYNGTGGAVDLSSYSLGWGGANYAYGNLQLSGTVASGECYIVGGPISDAFNYSPAYDQALDFSPDIQNAGTRSDGVALFSILAANITAASVPIDAVIYDSPNNSGLLDESGSVGAVDVGDSPSGNSIRRKSDGTWEIVATPDGATCPLP